MLYPKSKKLYGLIKSFEVSHVLVTVTVFILKMDSLNAERVNNLPKVLQLVIGNPKGVQTECHTLLSREKGHFRYLKKALS